MLMRNEIQSKTNTLPIRQQMGLWLILRLPHSNENNFSFRSSEFSEAFREFSTENVKASDLEYGRFIGGILSGLSRNGFLIKLSGDRNVLWTLSDEVKKNHGDYKKYLLEVKTYWPGS